MNNFCGNCGNGLTTAFHFCPTCGVPTAPSYDRPDISSDSPTVSAASLPDTRSQHVQATQVSQPAGLATERTQYLCC